MGTGAGITTANGGTRRFRTETRERTVGVGTGLCHAVGMTFLIIMEWVRSDLKSAGSAPSAASRPYLENLVDASAELGRQDWYRAVSDLYEVVSLGQPRAALWAAVFMAVVVRLNRRGPEKVQRAVSLVAAGYCVLTAVVMMPLVTVPGGGFFLALGVSTVVVWAVSL